MKTDHGVEAFMKLIASYTGIVVDRSSRCLVHGTAV